METQANVSPAVRAREEIPYDIRDLVGRIALALAVEPLDLMGDLGPLPERGRRIAAALAARRLLLPVTTTARLFGVAEAFVADALSTLDAVLAFTGASATHTPIAPLVAGVIEQWPRFDASTRRRIPVVEVQQIVARIYGVSVADMVSARRTKDVLKPRHVAIYLAKRFTLRSMPEIARTFGRHHSTIIYVVENMAACADAVAQKLSPDASIEEWAQALRKEMES